MKLTDADTAKSIAIINVALKITFSDPLLE
jgi:hypothetical protein